jgi:hypothetical protein
MSITVNISLIYFFVFQLQTPPRMRSSPAPSTSWPDTSSGVLAQAMATLHGNSYSYSPGPLNFSELLASGSQSSTPTTTALSDSFQEVLANLTGRETPEPANTQTHSEDPHVTVD